MPKSIVSGSAVGLRVPSYREIMDKLRLKKLARPYKQIRWEDFFRRSLAIIALVLVVLVLGIFVTLIIESIPCLKALGIKYLWGKTWNPVTNEYGAWPFLLGTLLTSFLALLISIPFSFAVAIYLGEYNPTGWLSNLLKNTVELIAAVPSVIYGFLGISRAGADGSCS
jgi:phosphate transport system permease protein